MTAVPRLVRSVLYVPASNERALAKAASLPCDAIIFDLEDAVAPETKEIARANAVAALASGAYGPRLLAVRINASGTPWHQADLDTLCAAHAVAQTPAVVIPKAESPVAIAQLGSILNVHTPATELWVMLETARGILYADQIAAAAPQINTLIMGTNDLLVELRASGTDQRKALHTSLSRAVLVARSCGLDILDGVYNDLSDADGLRRECQQGRDWGFDGKTLIHPDQIATANQVYAPNADQIAEAHAIQETWAAAQKHGPQSVTIHRNRLIEKLHVDAAARVIALDALIKSRSVALQPADSERSTS
jgi:citrate lyase subunit beta / citryl-CoA lyase